jgi:hypothetical protein
MLIATFGPTTGWAGKTITYEDGAFTLEGHGRISAQDVIEYERQGHLVWPYDGLREWVQSSALDPNRLSAVDPLQGKQQTPALRNKKLDPSLEAGEELLSVCGFFTGPRAIRIMSEIPGFFIIPLIPMLTLKYWVVGVTQKRTVIFVPAVAKTGGFRVRVEDVTLVDKGMNVIMSETSRPRSFWFQSSKKPRVAFTQAVAMLQNAETAEESSRKQAAR